MQFRRLGRTDLQVSLICLGTMTFGQQNSEAEGHEQLDMAVDAGANFIDTAEMYAIPPSAESQGLTEQYIGTWLKKSGQRDKVIVATKVTGPITGRDWIRGGTGRLDEANIREAVEGSLRRLNTDYIDLYQVHWPDRKANFFGQLGYTHALDEQEVPIEDTLGAMGRLVEEGKVRHVGVSNETAWGVMRYLRLAESRGLPRIVSIQNPYSLLNRSFEVGLAEIAHREDVGLLAYSPLAFGALSGKYLNGRHPDGGRLTLHGDFFDRYTGSHAEEAVTAYADLARRHDLAPATLALAFVNSRSFMTSNVIGATTTEQLQTNINSVHVTLSDEILAEIEGIHARYTYPCP